MNTLKPASMAPGIQIKLTSQDFVDQLLILQNIYPVEGWVYVGAGNGRVFEGAPFFQVEKLLAIEAEKGLHEQLASKINSNPGWKAINATIGAVETEINYYRYNLGRENGLLPPEVQSNIWKNLRLREMQVIKACTLKNILANEGGGFNYNWITFGCLPALPLLKSLGPSLESFDVIQTREALLDDELSLQAGATSSAIEEWLRKNGFVPVFKVEENHKQLNNVVYIRNWKARFFENSQAHSDFEINDENKVLRQSESRAISFCDDSLLDGFDSKVGIKVFLDEIVDDFAGKLTKQTKLLTENSEKNLAAVADLRKFLSSRVKKEVANGVRQVGDFINLQKYISTGALSHVDIEIDGWPASTDFLYYLVKQVERKSYDVIIELGSGTSTLIIAKAIELQQARINGKAKPEFLSFDHLECYYKNTYSRLQASGLSDWVNLIHAPLVDYSSPDGGKFIYYDCMAQIEAAGKKYLSDPSVNVLVVVDGPPKSTGENARYPIGPILLKAFSKACIDFLMDDADRPAEKNILDIWKRDFSVAGYVIREDSISLEKGAVLLSVFPRS